MNGHLTSLTVAGLGCQHMARTISFDAHTILQRFVCALRCVRGKISSEAQRRRAHGRPGCIGRLEVRKKCEPGLTVSVLILKLISVAACHWRASSTLLRGVSAADARRVQHWHVGVATLFCDRRPSPNRSRRLSIIDDAPRREFSPRQRHTLKEFAVGVLMLCC